MTSSPFPCRLNGVGYNTTEKSETDNWQFVGAAFQNVGEGTFIPLNAIDCVEGFEEGDQFQTSYLDDKGLVHFVSYDYWDGTGWVNGDGEEIGDSVGFILGKGAWFISSHYHPTNA